MKYEMKEEKQESFDNAGTLVYTNTIKYPYFLENLECSNQLNQRYRDIIKEYISDDTDSGNSFGNAFEDIREEYLPFFDDVYVEVTYNKNGYISLLERYTTWEGGGHPYSYFKGITFQIENGKEDVMFLEEKELPKYMKDKEIREVQDMDELKEG